MNFKGASGLAKVSALVLTIAIFFISTAYYINPLTASDSPSMWTADKNGNQLSDFGPGETVVIHGTNFFSDIMLDIIVTRPDGTIVDGSGEFINICPADGELLGDCYDTVLTDGSGGFAYEYRLDGIAGQYSAEAFDEQGAFLSAVTFTDSACGNGNTEGTECSGGDDPAPVCGNGALDADGILSEFPGTADMTGNVLLFHYNNDPAFGESGELIYDFSGTGNNGTCGSEGCPAYDFAIKKLGAASMNFDGTLENNFIRVLTNPTIDFGVDEDFSIAFWFNDYTKSNSTSDGPEFIDKLDRYQIKSPNINGAIRAEINDGINLNRITGVGDLSDGFWHHVVFVRDYDVGIFLYVDGVFEGNDTDPAVGSLENAINLTIGRKFYDGYMDELAIWGRVLSGDEVNQIYNMQIEEECDGDLGVGPHQTCNEFCELVDLTYCGDGIKQVPNDEGTGGPQNDGYEECDGLDGIGDNQECSASCELVDITTYCGDGAQDEGEECDDGNNDDGDGCSATCIDEFCGDGAINDVDEICDDGAGNGEACFPDYGSACSYCSDSCEPIEVQGGFCGDGEKNGPEQCDGTDGVVEFEQCTDNCALLTDTLCPLVEVIAPPASDPITWYADGIKVKASVSDPFYSSGIKEVRTGFHDLDHTWDDYPFIMSYNGSSGFFEYTWDSTVNEDVPACDIVQADVFGEDNAGNGASNQCGDTNTFGIDNSPPITGKDIGSPNSGGGYYVTKGTQITLTADDCGIGVDYIHYEIWWDSDDDGVVDTKVADENVLGTETTVYFEEESVHELRWYAVDLLGNIEEENVQEHAVDDTQPVIEKAIVGPYVGTCPPGDVDTCIIDGETEIHVTAVDPDPHPAGEVTCDWSYEVVDAEGSGGEQGVAVPFIINFPEESEHLLTITCTDGLGNEVTDQETFIVDKTPPVTTKTYGEPFFTAEGVEWATASTEITLDATDSAGAHDSGIQATYWRITQVDDEYCLSQEFCQQAEGSGDFNAYVSSFTNGEESCHLIEYYSIDNVDKQEEVNKQCVYVEDTPPESSSQLTGPQYYDESDGKLFVDGATQIELSCTDSEPHPSGGQSISYRYYVDGQLVQDWIEYSGPFSFPEESEHVLEYYCTDNLGNAEEVNSETYYVDHSPPTTTKEYGTPLIVNGGNDYITSNTGITLTAEDGEEVHDSGVYATYYRVTLLETDVLTPEICAEAEGSGEFTLYEGEFTINEDSAHLIEFYSVDNVEKTEETKRQCVFVDNAVPEITKEVGEPKVEFSGESCANGPCYYVTQDTPITVSATDPSPHPVMGVELWCEWTWTQGDLEGGNQQGPFLVDGPFTFTEDSFHTLHCWATDALGNIADLWEYDIVDSQPPVSYKSIEGNVYPENCVETGTCWTSQEVTVSLSCTDPEPHPVGGEFLNYRVTFNGETSDWILVEDDNVEIGFAEDSTHILEWFCYDALQNAEGIQSETDIVDTLGPEIEKWVVDDQYQAKPGDVIEICAEVVDVKGHLEGTEPGIGVDQDTVNALLSKGVQTEIVEMSLTGGNTYCGLWEVPEIDEQCINNHCMWDLEVEAEDLLGNYNAEDGIEILVDDADPQITAVLWPSKDKYYRDGKMFEVKALAIDFGGTNDPESQLSCPATGVSECRFYALKYDFESVNQSDIQDPEDYQEWLEELLTADPLVSVYLGSVPYEDGFCKGSLQFPEDSDLAHEDILFLAYEIEDNVGNVGSGLAEDWDGDKVTMKMDNQGPYVSITGGNLPGPYTQDDLVQVFADLVDIDSGPEDCIADLYFCGEGEEECTDTGYNLNGFVSDFVCEIADTLPAGLQSGDYQLLVTATDDEGNTGSDWDYLTVDNTRPFMNIIFPAEGGVYGAIVPVSLHVEDSTSIADETVMFKITEIPVIGNLFCFFGTCEDSGWIQLTNQGDGLYSFSMDTDEYGISGEGRYVLDTVACDEFYVPEPDTDLGFSMGNSRTDLHCRMLSEHGGVSEEERPECNDGIDNDDDGDIDWPEEGCSSQDDDDETAPAPVCGNNVIESGETCDDGNTDSGDGCSSVCQEEEEVLLINEFLPSPAGIDDGNEWIELYNPGSFDIDLSGWTIQDSTNTPDGLSGTVPSLGYLVLLQGTDFDFNLNNGSEGDIIILKDSGSEKDKAAYGGYDDGNTGDNAPLPGEGESAGRSPNGADTGVDSTDFIIFTTPTSGAANV